jgi:hypothetical protein
MSGEKITATNPNVVEMLDGRTVNFGTKAKSRVESLITQAEGGQNVKMSWSIRNGQTVTHEFFVPTSTTLLLTEIAIHGIQQKVGDSYSYAEIPNDVQASIELTLKNLKEGRWVKKQTSSSEANVSGLTLDLVEAVKRSQTRNGEAPKTDRVKTWIVENYAKDEEFIKKIKSSIHVKKALADITAEKAALRAKKVRAEALVEDGIDFSTI